MTSDNTRRWYTMPAADVVKHFSTDPDLGLTEKEARSRLRALGENEIFRIPHESFGTYMRRMAVNPLAVLLLVLLALSAFLGQLASFIVIGVTLAASFAIKSVTYVKSNRILENMGQYSLPLATVIRNGKMVSLPQNAIVPGDVIVIKEGQIIPADARLLEAEKLTVIEKGITEAEGSVQKTAELSAWGARNRKPHERTNMVFASTIVISGSGKAVVTETGGDTLVCTMGKNASVITYERMGLFGKLRNISYFSGLIFIVLTALLTIINILLPSSFSALDGLILVLSFCSAAMTESLVVFGYLTVAVGVYGTLDTRHNVNTGTLIRKIERLEVLKDIDTLMIPAESLCDENSVQLDKMYVYDRLLDIEPDGTLLPEAKQLLIKAVISTGKYTATRLATQNARTDSPSTYEEDAIISCALSYGLYNIELDEQYPIAGHTGAGDAPFETTLVYWYGEYRVIIRGEISNVLKCCSYCKPEGSNTLTPMTPLSRRAIETTAKQMMRQSHKVIAIASGVSKYNSLKKLSPLYADMIFEGIIGFAEPILPGASRSISRCRDAGIKVLLFTNDISEKNEYFASTLGIARMGSDFSVSKADYPDIGDKDFSDRFDDIRLFQGYNVSDRRKMIRLLQSKGDKVAYFARSTKEIILCLEADIGVTDALTVSKKTPSKELEDKGYYVSTGDALRFGSDVIVSPVSKDGKGGFNALTRALGSAKSIFMITKQILSYLLSVNLMRLILLLATLLSAGRLTFVSSTLTVISGLVFDFIMVFAIAFSKNERDVLKNRISSATFVIDKEEIISSCINGAAAAIFVILGCLILKNLYAFDNARLICVSFIAMLLSSSVIYFEGKYKTTIVKMPFDIGPAFAFDVLLFTLLIALSMLFPSLSALFQIVRLKSAVAWIIVAAIPVCVFCAAESAKAIKAAGKRKRGASSKKQKTG